MHVNGGPGGAGGPVGGPGTPTDPYKDAPYAKGKHFSLLDYIYMIYHYAILKKKDFFCIMKINDQRKMNINIRK